MRRYDDGRPAGLGAAELDPVVVACASISSVTLTRRSSCSRLSSSARLLNTCAGDWLEVTTTCLLLGQEGRRLLAAARDEEGPLVRGGASPVESGQHAATGAALAELLTEDF